MNKRKRKKKGEKKLKQKGQKAKKEKKAEKMKNKAEKKEKQLKKDKKTETRQLKKKIEKMRKNRTAANKAKEMVGQTQEITHRTWIHKLCSRSMCICFSKEWKNPWSARCACRWCDRRWKWHFRQNHDSSAQRVWFWSLGRWQFSVHGSPDFADAKWRNCIWHGAVQAWAWTNWSVQGRQNQAWAHLELKGAYPTPRRCWESGLLCGPLLSTVIISAGRTASKTSVTDSSRFAETQQSDPRSESDWE